MKHYYPAIFFPDEKSFGVIVPDLDGCFSQGDDLTQAMNWAVDAIGTYLDGVDEKDYPPPSKVSDIDTSEYPNAIVNVVEFDFDEWKESLNKIRKARKEAGISVKDLANLLGAPYRTVQNWDDGKTKPPKWLQNLIVEKIENGIY
jgi:predicted RNase H-like HicB family nuclease/DNA-binding XRE family transcriptional regulator